MLIAHRTHLPEQLSCHDGYDGLGRGDGQEDGRAGEERYLGLTGLYHDELLK